MICNQWHTSTTYDCENNARYLKNQDDLTSGSVYALALKIGNDPIDIL